MDADVLRDSADQASGNVEGAAALAEARKEVIAMREVVAK